MEKNQAFVKKITFFLGRKITSLQRKIISLYRKCKFFFLEKNGLLEKKIWFYFLMRGALFVNGGWESELLLVLHRRRQYIFVQLLFRPEHCERFLFNKWFFVKMGTNLPRNKFLGIVMV